MDDESDWRRQLLFGLGVLVVVAALVGGIIGVIAIKAADVAGIGSTTPADTSISFPTSTTKGSGPTSTQSTESEPTQPTDSTPPTRTPRQRQGITLSVSPTTARTYQRINLTGSYQAPPGTTLQVQRKEGSAWADFPTTASVSGGTFATYIETGRQGPNLFRMFDAGAGKASNVVTVQIS